MPALQDDAPAALFGFNLLDTRSFAHGQPHAAFDRMRTEAPVLRHPGSDKQPAFWVLTRHRDIQALSLDSERFTSTRGFMVPTDMRASIDPKIAQISRRFMLAMDRPEHDDYRNLVAPAFMPAALQALEPRVAAAVRDLMDGLKGRDAVEFVTEVAAIVPIKTVCLLLGVPPADEARIFDLTNAVFGIDDPEYSPTAEDASRNYFAVVDYGMWLLEQRRRDPKDDVMSRIANGRIDGEPLGEIEQKSFFPNLMGAGNETTRSSLAGSILALAEHKDQRDRLAADPGLIAGAINELLRYFSPVYHFARTAKTNLELAGQPIAEGDRVVMLYGAGNHDPEVFADPHNLDVARENANKHLTFGLGVHHCLGSRLAAMQLRLILGEFLRRFPKFEVAGEPAYLASNLVQAMKSLPVKLHA